MERILVIGGTGATGVPLVNGLLTLGHDVTVLHGGQHEVDFAEDVRHIHCDPHFADSLAGGLAGVRDFDVAVVMYGRLEHAVRTLAGRTGRVVAVGGIMGGNALPDDPRWGAMGMPLRVTEDDEHLLPDGSPEWPFGAKMASAERELFAAHERGDFGATYLGYPLLYGPHAPGPQDWSIVRRVLDGRRQIILQDSGLRYEMRGFTENMAHAVLLAATRPADAVGRKFYVADTRQYTARQRVEFIIRHLGADVEIVDIAYDQARPAHPFARFRRDHRIRATELSQAVLGYVDPVDPPDALARTVDWLVAHPPRPGDEDEQKIGDPFDYAREDRIVRAVRRFADEVAGIGYPLPVPAHQYRHPRVPGERWTAPLVDWRESTR
ncbi:MAG TPA: hypothetical protein VFW65_16520 [Pseudonocardiaceae bacterium]|nr:hypothetical protein [Pseudonocardiaceae bacterium]